MSYLNPTQIASLADSATTAAAYLDACDNGARFNRLDAAYYQACARLLTTIFTALDARLHLPDLLSQSPAARNTLECLHIERQLRTSCAGYYPELAVVLQRAAV
jgi:hypothetical protein